MNAQEKAYAEQFDKLEALLAQGAQPDQVKDPEIAQVLMVAQRLSNHQPEVELPPPDALRKSLLKKIRKRRFPHLLATGLGLAACVFFALLLMPKQQPAAPDGPQIVLDEDLLQHAIQNQARHTMLAYLQDTEHLLLAMRDFDVHCSNQQLDLVAEKKRAQDLLLQQKLFSTQMNRPQYLHARQLFDQLERILVDVNSMEPCTDPTEIDFINRHINENRILSKLRLVAQEFQVS